MPKMNVKKGDKVQVISGKDKGAQGEVLRAMPAEGKVIVEGVAIVKKHQKPTQMGQQGLRGVIHTAVALHGAAGTQFGKVARQFDVLTYRQKWQQIELLKDVARVVDPETITSA